MGGIVNMVLRMLMRNIIRVGIVGAIGWFFKRKAEREDLTPEDRAKLAESQKRTKQSLKVARRIGRF